MYNNHWNTWGLDQGPSPYVVNIEQVTRQNKNFRTALWTGEYLQMTLMYIPVCEDIGLEIHPDTDQFISVEEGQGIVMIGQYKNQLNFKQRICKGDAVFIPAGMWHNIVNTGNCPLKLASIYAPPHHPHGTVHQTKEDAED